MSEQIRDQYLSFYERMDPKDLMVVSKYKTMGTFFRTINDFLRSDEFRFPDHPDLIRVFRLIGDPKTWHDDVDTYKALVQAYVTDVVSFVRDMDRIIRSISIKPGVSTLYRGVDTKRDLLRDFPVGSEVVFREYLSTSISEETAFQYQSCGIRPCCLIVFRDCQHLPGLYIPEANFKVEQEILLPRGTCWKVHAHSKMKAKCKKMKAATINVVEMIALPFRWPKPFAYKLPSAKIL